MEKLGRFSWVISHLSGQTGQANPNSLSPKSAKAFWVTRSLCLSSHLLCSSLPGLWGGGWDSAMYIPALLDGVPLALEGTAGLGEGGGTCSFWSASCEDFSNTSLQWQRRPVTAAKCSLQIFQSLYKRLHYSSLRTTTACHRQRSGFNSRDTLLWTAKF